MTRSSLFFSFVAAIMFSLAASSFLPAPAMAASIVARTVVELTELSTLVVEARVVSQESFEDGTGGIMTRTTVEVADYLKGSGPDELDIHQVGGSFQGRVMTLHGDLQMRPGEHLVLFLRSAEGALWPTLLGWSAFVVQGEGPEASITRPSADLALHIEGVGGRLEPVSPHDISTPPTLGALAAEIRTALEASR